MKFVYTTGARPLDGYTVKRGVGIGGFGEVYFATSDAGKEVALKRVQRNLDVELRGVTQCLNLKHSNLIAIYDIKYDDGGDAWIVMEFVSGESLKEVIARNPNGMPVADIKHWFTGIATGVACLHDHGIVHRDLKPGNIFDDEGVVKIGDYGLSKFISCSRRSGQTESVGTFHYMAPEIGKGSYGKEIDVYALGIMLFEMLTGQVPFEGETSQEIIMKHLTASPDLGPVPRRFRGVIERSLFKDPAKRFPSVNDMLQAVQFEPHHEWQGRGQFEKTAATIAGEPEPSSATAQDEPMVIDDENIITDDDIVFGPVVEVVSPATEKPPVASAAGASREPIAAAVGAGLGQLSQWWNGANPSTPVKVVILVAAILLLIVNSEWLIPTAILLGTLYLFYRGIRAMIGAPRISEPAAGQAASREAARHRHHQDRRRHQHGDPGSWDEQAREVLDGKPFRQRMSELTGGFLMAAIVSCVLSLIILIAVGHRVASGVQVGNLYAWLAVTSVTASWLILGLSKFWETTQGDEVLRRFVMLVAGLAIGVAAFAASDMLMITLSTSEMFNVLELPADIIPHGMYVNGTPELTAFLAFFATLFLVLRWWRQVDPLRRTRFSVFATFLCGLVAALIPWQIPWGFLLAITISLSIQLASPWMSPARRKQIRQEARAA